MATFNLTISLSNDAMQTAQDVAHALYEAAEKIDARDDMRDGRIYDANGNKVGEWNVSK